MSNLSDIKVVVDPNNSLSARVGSQNTVKVVSSVIQETSSNELLEMTDVNITPPIEDGSILVYNAATSKWENVDEIDGGSY